MNPSWAARNLTPNSTAEVSGSIRSGTAVDGQIEQGQVGDPPDGHRHTRSWRPRGCRCRRPHASESSTVPMSTGLKVYVQASRPVARRHVSPSSIETSTPPTRPPPLSIAVPVIDRTRANWQDVTRRRRGDRRRRREWCRSTGVAIVSPGRMVAGWTPMSANRLTVACWAAGSAGRGPRSCLSSSPHDHWIVPAPKTSAPLAWRYIVIECVAEPWRVGRAVVLQDLAGAPYVSETRNSARRSEAVVEVLVPLVADDVGADRRGLVAGQVRRRGCCARNACRRRSALTTMSTAQQLTREDLPVSAFSGRPPSPGGLNRGSRQVPVQVGAADR